MTEVTARGLTKTFGRVTAVRDMSFTAPAGKITGFLGPNGSGKTTTLRMTLGLVRPTGGTALIGGVPYDQLDHPRRRVGALLEATGFHPGRRARDHLRVLAAAERIPDRRVNEVLGQVGLAEAAEPPGARVLPRHAAAPRHRRGPARRPGGADPGRAGERARPGGHRLAARPAPRPRRRGPHHRAGQSPARRDRPDRRATCSSSAPGNCASPGRSARSARPTRHSNPRFST